MKQALLPLVLIFLCFVGWVWSVGNKTELIVLPQGTTRALFQQIGVSPSTNGLVVLNAWATWCGPCLQELPTLNQLVGQHPQVQFIAVSDEDSAKVSAFWFTHPKLHFAYKQYHHRTAMAALSLLVDKATGQHNAAAIPQHFILQGDTLLFHSQGALTEQQRQTMEQLLSNHHP